MKSDILKTKMYNNKIVKKNNKGKLIIKRLFNKIKKIHRNLFQENYKKIIIELFQILFLG